MSAPSCADKVVASRIHALPEHRKAPLWVPEGPSVLPASSHALLVPSRRTSVKLAFFQSVKRAALLPASGPLDMPLPCPLSQISSHFCSLPCSFLGIFQSQLPLPLLGKAGQSRHASPVLWVVWGLSVHRKVSSLKLEPLFCCCHRCIPSGKHNNVYAH